MYTVPPAPTRVSPEVSVVGSACVPAAPSVPLGATYTAPLTGVVVGDGLGEVGVGLGVRLGVGLGEGLGVALGVGLAVVGDGLPVTVELTVTSSNSPLAWNVCSPSRPLLAKVLVADATCCPLTNPVTTFP